MSYFNDNLGSSNKANINSTGKMYIANMIDDNQAIKRLTRYLTKTPLSKKGKTYNGELINQTDLECSLLEDLKTNEDVNAIGRTKILIPYAFDEKLLEKDQVFIFVSSRRARFNKREITGEYLFEVTVAYPRTYEELLPVGTERFGLIAENICNMFDNVVSEGENAKNLGNILFRVAGFEEEKLSTQGYIKSTILITTEPIVDRRF